MSQAESDGGESMDTGSDVESDVNVNEVEHDECGMKVTNSKDERRTKHKLDDDHYVVLSKRKSRRRQPSVCIAQSLDQRLRSLEERLKAKEKRTRTRTPATIAALQACNKGKYRKFKLEKYGPCYKESGWTGLCKLFPKEALRHLVSIYPEDPGYPISDIEAEEEEEERVFQ